MKTGINQLLLLVGVLWSTSAVAQRPQKLIDTAVINRWTDIEDGASISNDGRYVQFSISNKPRGSNTLVITSTESERKLEIEKASSAQFSDDSRYAVMNTGSQEVLIVDLKNFQQKKLPGSDFKLIRPGKQELILMTMKDRISVNSLDGKQLYTVPATNDYKLSKNTYAMAYVSGDELYLLDLLNGHQQKIWSGKGNIGDVCIDREGKQVAFIVDNGDKSIWWYAAKNGKARVVLDSGNNPDSLLDIGGISHFSQDGLRLFFSLREKPRATPPETAAPVDVWNYQDASLQSKQLNDLGLRSFKVVIDLRSKKAIRLEQENDHFSFAADAAQDTLLLGYSCISDTYSEDWNRLADRKSFVINTINGRRKELPYLHFSAMSPGGKFFVGWENSDLFSYDITTSNLSEVTKALPIPKLENSNEVVPARAYYGLRGLRLEGWLKNDLGIIVGDRYDLWLIDPTGRKSFRSLTGGYGRKHSIIFSIAVQAGRGQQTIVDDHNPVILTAFNEVTKEGGFYKVDLKKADDPQKINMGRYVYDNPLNNEPFNVLKLFKARDTKAYLVPRCSPWKSPNYFYTRDFAHFKPISNNHPELDVIGMNSKLVDFKATSGRVLQGMLYTPKDFDSTRKYPVIISYYEKRSHTLNTFLRPDLSSYLINIPWFVSRDYLVFVPDIYYEIGHPQDGILASIDGAADYLENLSWIDANRMGLQGHSFSGYETNCVITQSSRFAAACSAAGPAEYVSYYGTETNGSMGYNHLETGQLRLGVSLFERPDLYLSASPLVNLDKVTTPILFMHNKGDGAVPFNQGQQLFVGLRRMGKRAWLLQYDDSSHETSSYQSNLDYTTRMTQFFDHYLKGAPAPVWMTRGVPAKDKGIKTGYEYDQEISTPGPGLTTPEEAKKIEEYSKKSLKEKLMNIK